VRIGAPSAGLRSDYALLVLAVQTGLRVSELISLTGQDVHLVTAAHVSCHGKVESNESLRCLATAWQSCRSG
jgi:site-specific recombinase XerD